MLFFQEIKVKYAFRKVVSVLVEKDDEFNVSYVKMKDPTMPEISFVRSPCYSKQVLKVGCENLGKSQFTKWECFFCNFFFN